jgi:hypothetical protein
MPDTTEKFTEVLLQNVEKEKDKHPDFTGKINLWGSECNGAAWLRESKEGSLYFSLRLIRQGENEPTAQYENERTDEFIRLWHQENGNRFRGKGTVQGQVCIIEAWIRPASKPDGLICLDLSIREDALDPESMPPVAREIHERLRKFLSSVQVEDSESTQKPNDLSADETSDQRSGGQASNASSSPQEKQSDRDLDVEPDNIPF